ncbi:unnamed protein product, partial [Mycena citricolor]
CFPPALTCSSRLIPMDVDMEPVASGSDIRVDEIPDAPIVRKPRSPSPPPRASSVPLNPTFATVGFVYSAEMMAHRSTSQQGHPEDPERIMKIWDALTANHYVKRGKRIPTRMVQRHEALLVHSDDLWDKVEAIQHMSSQDIAETERYYEQLSLYVCQATTRSARLSCGGVIEATLAVARDELQKAFAVVRPPGHHAEPDEHMGFCFFNNVAVASRVVQQLTPVKKILILDWDVHHGNGTQRAFNDDPSVLYISIHRYEKGGFYPCGPFGGLQSCGEGPGLGFSVNIPWPEAGMGDAEYLHAFQQIVMPIAMEFAPDLVIISAGFDAAHGDELGECHVTPAGYAHMTYMLAGLAGGRMVVALEGGYNLDSITNSALAVTDIIMGGSPPEMKSMVPSDVAAETIWLVAREQSKYWKNVNPRACEPEKGKGRLGGPFHSRSYTEVLKLHRQYYMHTAHDMMSVPLVSPSLEQLFAAQVMCTPNIFGSETLVLLVHEFGNLRVELASSLTCEVQLERSYLIDFAKDMLEWAKEQQYAVLDSMNEARRDLATYLWDNYVQLCNAQTIILIGHGHGCRYLMDLIDSRASTVMKTVKAVVQVMGYGSLRPPKNTPELRQWYRENCLIALPSNHEIYDPVVKDKEKRKHGTLLPVDEVRTVKLIIKAFPAIKAFIKAQTLKVS